MQIGLDGLLKLALQPSSVLLACDPLYEVNFSPAID